VASFSSLFINKIDRKGRVSVPASFRAALAGQSFNGIVVYPSIKLPALEASGVERVEELIEQLDHLPEFSAEYDALASLLPDVQQLAFDGEGRVTLPPALIAHAGLSESAAFAGFGHTFRIWEPERFKVHQQEMRELVRQRGLSLPPRRTPR